MEKFLPLRKAKHKMDEARAWAVLESERTVYGFLGAHGLPDENAFPYVVPMNFTADESARAIYLHTTVDAESKRNRAVEANPNVTFVVVDPDSTITPSTNGLACGYSMKFESVMVFGRIEKVESAAEKTRVLNLLMVQKAAGGTFKPVAEFQTAVATIYKIDVAHISGAAKG